MVFVNRQVAEFSPAETGGVRITRLQRIDQRTGTQDRRASPEEILMRRFARQFLKVETFDAVARFP